MRGLNDKTAIVTGAGSGIGRATALRLAEEGMNVAIGELNPKTGAAAALEIEAAGGRAIAVTTDVSDPEHCAELVAQTLKAFGGVQALINNAGVEARNRTLEPLARWDWGIENSLSSMYRMSEAAIPALLENPASAIVNVSSIIGTRTYGITEWYGAAKAGVTGLTRSQAGMHGKAGLRANAVCPGTIRTQRTVTLTENEQVAERVLHHQAIRRFGEPEDVASVIAFLASDDAGYVSGEMITIDGGWSLN